MADCPKCKRPKTGDFLTGCFAQDGALCNIAAAAYRRGVADMLAAAKRTAYADTVGMDAGTVFIDWTETEREAAKLAGEGT